MNSIWTTGRTSLGLGWAVLVLGAWLIISPFALGFAHSLAGTANNIAVGAALVGLTLGSTRNGLLRALLVLLGGWTYASGFILEVPEGIFLWNNLLAAVLIIAGSVASETPYPPDYIPRPPQR
jgi:hypothetical protein